MALLNLKKDQKKPPNLYYQGITADGVLHKKSFIIPKSHVYIFPHIFWTESNQLYIVICSWSWWNWLTLGLNQLIGSGSLVKIKHFWSSAREHEENSLAVGADFGLCHPS